MAKKKKSADGEEIEGAEENIFFDGTGTWALGSAVPVPEPGTLGLFLCGLGLIGVMRRRLKARE
jgi:hypothetical protein